MGAWLEKRKGAKTSVAEHRWKPLHWQDLFFFSFPDAAHIWQKNSAFRLVMGWLGISTFAPATAHGLGLPCSISDAGAFLCLAWWFGNDARLFSIFQTRQLNRFHGNIPRQQQFKGF